MKTWSHKAFVFFLVPSLFCSIGNLVAQEEKQPETLIELAKKEFGVLARAEIKFFEHAATGKVAKYEAKTEPNRIRGKCVKWLLEDSNARELLPKDAERIGAIGAKFDRVSIRNAKFPFSLSFLNCEFQGLDFLYCELDSLHLNGSKMGGFGLIRCEVENFVYLNRIEARIASCSYTKVGKNFFLVDAKVASSISLENAEIGEGLHLDRAEIRSINLTRAKISYSLEMQDAKFGKEANEPTPDNEKKPDEMTPAEIAKALNRPTGDAIKANELMIGRNLKFSTKTWINGNAEFESLQANAITMSGSAGLNMVINGRLNLSRANIKSKVDLRFTRINNPNGDSLFAEKLTVGHELNLEKIECKGEVRMPTLVVGDDLVLKRGKFESNRKHALFLQRAQIAGSAYLDFVQCSSGDINFGNAKINGQMSFAGAKVDSGNQYAIYGQGMEIGAELIFLNGFEAKGQLQLSETTAREIWLSNSHYSNPKNPESYAVYLNSIETKFLSAANVKCDGEFRMIAAKVGQIMLKSGLFNNPGKNAIVISNCDFETGIRINEGFESIGHVSLGGNRVKSSIRIEQAKFNNPRKLPLERYSEALRLSGTTVEGSVEIIGSEIIGGLSLANLKASGPLVVQDLTNSDNCVMDFRNADVGSFHDDEQSWPVAGNLYVHGFKFERIGDESPKDAQSRLDWLGRISDDRFTAEPYEHLAKVLDESGRQDDATAILIAKAKRQGEQSAMFSGQGFWYRVLGPLIGYGYQPWRALWIGLVIIIFGWIIFTVGEKFRIVTPSKEAEHVFEANEHRLSSDYPVFEGLMYSIDVFVPLLDLHQANYWMPSAKRGRVLIKTKLFEVRTGRILRVYFWFQIFAGWTLTTLLVSALSGILRL